MIDKLLLVLETLSGIRVADPVVELVLLLFLFMGLGIVSFFIGTVLLILTHRISGHFQTKWQKHFTDWIIQYLLDPSVPRPDPEIYQRKAFRHSILDLLMVMRGTEKNSLLLLYRSTGLWELDLENLRSPFWHMRLAALARLDLWQFCLGAERLLPLIGDMNFQIRQIAMKNFSRTKVPEEAVLVLTKLERGLFHFSVKYEVIYRLIRVHREIVLDFFQDTTREDLRVIILKVIGDVRVLEGVPTLLSVCEASTSEKEIEAALIALGSVGDPRSVKPLKESLTSLHSSVRLAALKSLAMVEPNVLKANGDKFESDPDPIIASWYGFLRKALP